MWGEHWTKAVILWAVLVLVFSTRTEIRGAPFVWVLLTWPQALEISAAQWSLWGLLALAIIAIDRRLPVRRDALVLRVLWHVPLSFVFTLAHAYAYYGALSLLDAPRDPSLLAGGVVATSWRLIPRNSTFVYWVIVGVYIALDYQRHLKDRELKNSELERLLSDARLAALRAQLQPHFLFNALHAVSAYVESRPHTARLMIEQLADLLRLSLDHTSEQEIPLRRELAFVERYLQLQAVRFEGRLTVSLAPSPDVLDALVPPFILQPLVENAIRHGTTQSVHGGSIRVDARHDNGRVHLSVTDNGPGLPEGWAFESHAGIGLSNTLERLRQLYGGDQQAFAIGGAPGGGVRVDLLLPYRLA
jgi:two-component system, LytTR family, sensor kinase